MLDYLQKYNELETALKEEVSSPAVMAMISEIEKEYNISLAVVVMRVMVKDISIVDLSKFFVFEYNLDGARANELVDKLKEKVFFGVADYLGIIAPRVKETAKTEDSDVYLENKKEEAGVRSSNFFFSPEDEEEVKELTKKLNNFSKETPVKKDENIEKKVEKFLAEININFSSEELNARLGNIISIYLKGVRNKIDTKQTIMKPVADGGLDLDDILSSKAISLADKINKDFGKESQEEKVEFKQEPDLVIAKEKNKSENLSTEAIEKKTPIAEIADRDAPYDFKTLKSSPAKVADDKDEIKQKEMPGAEPKPMDLHTLNLKLNPVSSEKPVSASEPTKQLPVEKTRAVINLNNNKKENYAKNVIASANSKIPSIPQSGQDVAGKIKMEDVKHVPKLTGPVDELGELDTVNFRRLNNDANSAVKKILEKINFLEEESYAKRLEGIKAWRNSPINKLYLRIGQESINNKTGINIVINKRMSENKDYISEPEFNAIMDLNKNLRF